MKKYGRVIHNHHISYQPEVIVKCFAGEHRVISLMQIYGKKTVSKGFLRCLRRFIKEHKDKAVKL